MLYLIGLGLNDESISLEGLAAVKDSKEVYLEGYTVDFPYKQEKLEKTIGKKIGMLKREDVENNSLVKESERKNIALLIYGSPLFATTHTSIIADCIDKKIKYQIIYSASVFDSIAETGLQLYKFGKITSMPTWKENYKPDSFAEIIKENNSIKAHTLILVDIGLDFEKALEQLEETAGKNKISFEKIILCSSLGTEKRKVFFNTINNLKKLKDVPKPFCIIIPSNMHFFEKEFLEKICE
jgi:diphthine synthase